LNTAQITIPTSKIYKQKRALNWLIKTNCSKTKAQGGHKGSLISLMWEVGGLKAGILNVFILGKKPIPKKAGSFACRCVLLVCT
jgi:hypothetical protein